MFCWLHAESYVVITHPKTPLDSLTQWELKAIYLKQRRFWKDTKLTTLNLPPDHPLRKEFENDILQMPKRELDQYWMKQHYKGYRPPYRVESVQSMLMFVQKVEGAIGYIPKSALNSDVKVIYEGSSQ